MSSKCSEHEPECLIHYCSGTPGGPCRLWKLPPGAEEVGPLREPARAVATRLGPVQIRQGSNGRHRHPVGRQEESLPCHPDTDAAMPCVGLGSRRGYRRKSAGVKALYQRHLVRGKVYAIDGSGLGDDFRLVGPGVRVSDTSDHCSVATPGWASLGEG